MIRLLALLLLLSSPTLASQNSIVLSTTSPYPGLTMLNNANSAFNTLMTNSSGSAVPSTIYQYQFWYDSSNNLMKWTPDGSTWQSIGKYSGSLWVPISSGVPLTCPTSTGSSNAYVVTYAPTPTGLNVGQRYCFLTNFSNTGAATVNINSLGAKNLTKRGATTLATGDLGSGAEVECIYDGTQCQVVSQLSSASSGTVTAVATGTGLTGGTITNSGTISLASVANNTVMGNTSGISAAPSAQTSPVVSGTIGAQAFNLASTGSVPAGATGVYSTGPSSLSLATTGAIGMTVGSDQGVTVGAATGGDQGPGTVNMTGCFVNGVACTTGPGSGMIYLATVDCPSGCAAVTFNSTFITNSYNKYVIEYDSVYANGLSDTLTIDFSTNNGSSYLGANISMCPLGGTSMPDSAAQALSGTTRVSNPQDTSVINAVSIGGAGTTAWTLQGSFAPGSAVNNLKIFSTFGGSLHGAFHLYALTGT